MRPTPAGRTSSLVQFRPSAAVSPCAIDGEPLSARYVLAVPSFMARTRRPLPPIPVPDSPEEMIICTPLATLLAIIVKRPRR